MKAALKIPSGRHRYKAVPIPDDINTVKFVQLLVVQAERAWAYAITLKGEHALGEARAPGRIRHRYIHKFHRAAYWSKKLLELAQRCCDDRTQLECEAYHFWLSGLAHTEAGDYQGAMKLIDASVEKYNELVKGSLDSIFPGAAKAYRHRITDLDPVMRVCKYKSRVGIVPQKQAEAEPGSPKSIADFESAHGMSDEGEGEVEFSDSDMSEDDEAAKDQKKTILGAVAGKIGGWWSKS